MKNISRRSFLKGSAAMGLLTAMGSATLASAEENYTYADTIKWDAQYDVVVLGMGFAGMNAAIAAADAGAGVLLAEKTIEGKAGGNSKVCGQLFAYGGEDEEATMAYYKALTGGRAVEEETLKVIANGVAHMWGTLRDKYFEGKDAEFMNWTGISVMTHISPEYPEFAGSDKIGICSTHMGAGDSFLYSTIKSAVIARKEKIDVWYESPAIELIQDPQTKTILGVKISRKGEERNVRALNGVVVATGGFEANPDMIQQYLGFNNYAAQGGQYNTGDGIRMCQKAGAQLWHMSAYEGLCGFGSLTWPVEIGTSCQQFAGLMVNAMNSGASMVVGTDGHRFFNEAEVPRHGHVYENGVWENISYPEKVWLVFDKTQKALIEEEKIFTAEQWEKIGEYDTVEALAEATGCKADVLKDTVEAFNSFAVNGKDYTCGRDTNHMRPFDGEKYYAAEMIQGVLNTQGGPKRNQHAEILDLNGNPIPHLYSAGEMGGITACMYQGGTNVAECVIFGEIAGKNAAAAKEALPAYTAAAKVESTPLTLGMDTDIGVVKTYETAEGQYVGTGKGMMGDVTVRVTMADGKISIVEVLEQSETVGIGDKALEAIPSQFVGCSTAEEIDAVDTISGGTMTSKALKEAVKNALAQAK